MKTFTAYLENKLSTAQTLFTGYLFFTLIGTFLLMLPISSENNLSTPFIDALFTATSAVSTTGLIVVDTGSYYSLFGEIVVLMLIQVGGIGYMLFFALAVFFLGGKLSIYNKLVIRDSISRSRLDLKLFVGKVFKYTFVIEGISALLLTVYWAQEMPFGEAVRQGVFHSISAFCTAGFSLFTDSLMSYKDSSYINIVIMLTSYAGCIGYFVMYDLSNKVKSKFIENGEKYRLSTHSKLVLIVSLGVIAFVSLIIIVDEMLIKESGEVKTVMEAIFQSVSASTTVGFNTVDVAKMKDGSQLGIIFEMFIGASPSSTGGGIKTTVFAVMCLALFTFIRDRKSVSVMKRSVPAATIARAFSISLLSLIWLFIVVLLITITDELDFLSVLFETGSALGTVGLSMGITSALSDFGKTLIIITMFIGRVGPLVVGYTLLGKNKDVKYQYPDGDILIV